MTDETISYEIDDHGVATIRFDDGKANAISHDVIGQLTTALHQAESEARAALIVGRPERFSAGFDLGVIRESPKAAMELVNKGAVLAVDIFESPIPVVMACTGHAIAMGAILLMSADVRIGTEGNFKIGLSEVAIGMPLPKFAVLFADNRLSKRHFTKATMHAHLYKPLDAVDAGFLDEVALPDDMYEVAHHRTVHLAKTLDPQAFRETRKLARAEPAKRIRGTLGID